MSTEQHAWSEEKQQRLHEQLPEAWTEDVWVIGRKDTPKKQGRIRFILTSPSLKIELKYALWHKFDSGQWRFESDAIQRTAFLTVIFRWLDHFTPPIQSLMEKSLDQWELSLRSYLIQKGYYKRKVRKALNTTQQYVEHTFEDKRICLFRQLYTIVFDAYDDRPETEKDRWDLRKLGVQVRPTKSQYYLNFAHIAPSWLLQLTKQFMQYNLAVHSPADCEWKLICIRSLSEFLTTHEPTVQARNLDRALMVRYMHFLRERYPTARTRNHILVDLRAFLETCTYHLQIGDLPKERIIFPEDLPKRPVTAPRDIPEEILVQLREHLDKLETTLLRMVTILLECGLRLEELCALPLDCLICDDRHEWYLRFYQNKLSQEHIIPLVDEKVIRVIQAQQEDIRTRWGNTSQYLFPSLCTHLRPYQQQTFTYKLNQWAVKHDIRDRNKTLYRFTAHKFRHTVGMRLLNEDVPLEVISRLLGHHSLEMTQVYARVKEKKLRAELERVARKRKTVDYQGNAVKGDRRANDLEVQMVRRGMRGQTLAVGGCGRLVVLGECSHANKCLTCPMWLTSTDDLPKLKSFYERAIRLKQRAIDIGNQVVTQQQDHIITSLTVRIKSLEATEMDGSLCVDDVLTQLKNDLMEAESGLEEARSAGLVLAARHLERAILEIKARIAALEEPA